MDTTTMLTSDEIRAEYFHYVLHPWSVQAESKPLVIVGGKGATVVSKPIADDFESRLLPMGFTNGGQALSFAAALVDARVEHA